MTGFITQNPGIGGLDELTTQEEVIVQNIASLGDPNADRILFWDDSAGSFQYLTVGTNLSITGTTLNATGGGGGGTGMTWSEVTGTSQSASNDNGYITNNASLVTVTLPASAAVGKVVRVTGKGAGGWRVAQNASQQIIWNEGGVDGTDETTVGVTGHIDSTDDYDSIELICITANTTWGVLSSKGNISIT